MDKLAYTTVNAMKSLMHRQTAIANNMANSETVGFKSDMVSAKAQYLNGPGHNSRAMSVDRDMQADMNGGAITKTDRPLDIALEGDAMLAVQDADGKEAYTKRGDLKINPSGTLLTGDGFPVLGDSGPVTLPPSERVDIGSDGTISYVPVGGDPTQPLQLGKLKLVSVTGSQISKGADTLFHVADDGTLPVDDNAKVISGALEGSNVNMTSALVDMIETSRAWETQAKLLKTAEDLDDSGAGIMSLPQ
ncbi:flagellar basal body rod protein FlgF [Parasphingorhabdus sp.]|jgi:flagellar basal-body rod protein FlgF|uniref:flagellar basal body rod protein FlgF n=1 Tax=Parasphingorhabdus sp. TaxID=2709688 RepID=UPI0030035E43